MNNSVSSKTTHGLNLFLRKIYHRLRTSPLQGMRKAWRILSGPGGLYHGLDIARNVIRISHQYKQWQQAHHLTTADLLEIKQTLALLKYQPKISILLPVYNTEERWLRRAIDSVRQQLYPQWELCIADDASTMPHIRNTLEAYRRLDPRIKVVYHQTNGHISAASNSALRLATGEFVALLDHDDEIAPLALFEVIKLLNKYPQADLIYSDEDRLEPDGSRSEPFFKPDWSPYLLQSINYITHFAVLRRSVVEHIGGFRDAFVGSQDHDLFLRFTEQSDQVYHIPKVLYSWRKIPTSTALDLKAKPYSQDATFRALTEVVRRRALPADVVPGSYPPLLRIRHRIVGTPLVSIIIYSDNSDDAISTLKYIQNLSKNTAYQNCEIIIVAEPKYGDELRQAVALEQTDVVIALNSQTSLSESLSIGAAQAQGEFLLFLGKGIQPVNDDWLTAMLEYAQLPGTGCVGAKLRSKQGHVVSAGMALGINGVAGHPGRGLSDVPQIILYLNLKDMVREVSAVSAACLMIRRKLFHQVNGFDAAFQHAFCDVDLCLRLSQLGYRNLYTPYAKLEISRPYALPSIRPRASVYSGCLGLLKIHNNWIINHIDNSHGDPSSGLLLQQKWCDLLCKDPYYNPNFTRNGEDFGLRVPDTG